jgi:carbonic anhydrase
LKQKRTSKNSLENNAFLSCQLDDSYSDLNDALFPSSLAEPDDVGEIAGTDTFLEFLTRGEDKSYGIYRGSLSYPPCTRNVNWLVSKEVYKVTQEQVMSNLKIAPNSLLNKI